MMHHPAIRFALQALMVFGVLRLASMFIGPIGLMAIVAASAVVALILWMHHFQQDRLADWYEKPGCKQVIGAVCRVTKRQPPTRRKQGAQQVAEPLRLKQPSDYDKAIESLRRVVRGHDTVVEQLLDNLRSEVILREKAVSSAALPPLGVFVLVGPEGIGKAFLARKLAVLLYRKPGLVRVSMRDYPDDASAMLGLFGSESRAGRLIGAVKTNPHHVIIIENIDATTEKVQDALAQLCSTGTLIDPQTGSRVDFRHTVVVFTKSAAADAALSAVAKTTGRRKKMQRLIETLSGETMLTESLLTHAHDLWAVDRLSQIEAAEVVVLLMKKECRRVGIDLEFVEPELIADEVARCRGEPGFSSAPARIARLLRDPLVRAARTSQGAVSLRQREITMLYQPEAIPNE